MHEKKKKKKKQIYIYRQKKSRLSVVDRSATKLLHTRCDSSPRTRTSAILFHSLFLFPFFCLRSIHPLPILFSSIKKKKKSLLVHSPLNVREPSGQNCVRNPLLLASIYTYLQLKIRARADLKRCCSTDISVPPLRCSAEHANDTLDDLLLGGIDYFFNTTLLINMPTHTLFPFLSPFLSLSLSLSLSLLLSRSLSSAWWS